MVTDRDVPIGQSRDEGLHCDLAWVGFPCLRRREPAIGGLRLALYRSGGLDGEGSLSGRYI